MNIYATLHTAPTRCTSTVGAHKMLYITRGASAQLTYPLFDKVFKFEDIEQLTFMFKQGRDLWGYSMFEDSDIEKTTVNPRFYFLADENYSAIILNLDSDDTKQFKPGINIEYEVVIKLNTDSLAIAGNRDSVIIEPQHPIAVVDSLYSAL